MNASNKLIVALAVVAVSPVAVAHHGLGGRYDQDSTLELEGEVSRILWRNPHIRLKLSVTGDGGEAATWAVEGTAPTIIQRYGITDGMVNEGDIVRVAGFPSSRGLNEISIHNLLLPDGRELLLDPRFRARWSDETVGQEGSFLRIREGDRSAPDLGIFRVWATTIAQPGSYPLFPESANPELSQRYPLTDEARARLDAFDPATDNPTLADCLPKGMPTIMEQPYPMEFMDQDDVILLRIEEYDLVRTIYMEDDPPDTGQSLLGQSVGHWDGSTLVVTTTEVDWPHFNQMGVFLTPDAEIVERFTPSEDGGRLDYQLIVTDPAVFTEPAVVEKFWLWDPELQVEEFNCTESY